MDLIDALRSINIPEEYDEQIFEIINTTREHLWTSVDKLDLDPIYKLILFPLVGYVLFSDGNNEIEILKKMQDKLEKDKK